MVDDTKSVDTPGEDKLLLSKWAKSEAFFFNQGGNIAFLTILFCMNVSMAVWGAWLFTEPHWVTQNDYLRITLPIARASGRVVSWNSGLVILSGCKYFWTVLRHSPLQHGFPIDSIMPKYHRIVALTIIVMGCIFHTIPQIVNYASETLTPKDGPLWTFGEGVPQGQAYYTGILLVVFFSAFFVTTLERFRRTSIGFRVFWWVHVISITSVIPLLIIHGTILGDPITVYFMSLPLLMYIMDVIMRRVKYAHQSADLVELRAIDKGGERVTKVVIKNKDFVYTTGQYAELKLEALSISEWHPFTIASAPSEDGTVVFYVKALGRWTNALYELANSKHDIKQIGIRGPFGAPAQNYTVYKHIIVIGSGIGVTPLLSVWNTLVLKTKDMVVNPLGKLAKMPALRKIPKDIYEQRLLDKANVDNVDLLNWGQPLATIKAQIAYGSSILESMTVNVILFVFSFVGETIIFCVWIYEHNDVSAWMQLLLSMLMIAIFGSKIILSTLAYGTRYLVSFSFKLELLILFIDGVSYVSSIMSVRSPSREAAILYFTFYAAFILLHGVRIFYIFYATSKPLEPDPEENKDQKIHTVTGIWVAKSYAAMGYAIDDLIGSIGKLPSAFSLQLYCTRDKESEVKDQDPFLGMSDKHELKCGRPDWEEIMTEAIENAHSTNPEGDAIGVFFCGSPAIARTLQRIAQKVNADHQFRCEGDCTCRILVHKENF